MFTGIVSHSAAVLRITNSDRQSRVWISNPFADLLLGESVSVNGICLTVTDITPQQFTVDISLETLQVTTTGEFNVGQVLNLERALQSHDRLGGHIVTGHVDQTLMLHSKQACDDCVAMTFSGVQPEFRHLLVAKGSVTINGVSLTINSVAQDQLNVMVIPHTLAATNLSQLSPGQAVNIEFDYLAKLVKNNVASQEANTKLDVSALQLTSSNSLPQGLISVDDAVTRLQRGQMVIVVDAKDRENEGDIVIAGQFASAEAINFMSQYGRGLICMPMAASEFARLDIPMMTQHNRSPLQTAFGVSIGAAHGIGTGISAHDRALTIRTAANPNSGPSDIVMPGHMFPLKARDAGVIERAGHTEASVDLMKIAGLNPVAVVCEVMKPDGTMARLPDLLEFAAQHDLGVITIQDILQYRLRHEALIKPVADAKLPIQQLGEFRIVSFSDELGANPVAIIKEPVNANVANLVRVHSECLTGDVFGSLRCDCGQQLQYALQRISQQGGILIYLHQEGRGIGLVNKIKAYALQDKGLDTVEANHKLGFAADLRDYAVAAQILRHFSIKQVKLMTNNPHKIADLEKYGIRVIERLPVEVATTPHNLQYMQTKRDKLGHLLNQQTLECERVK